MRAPSPALALVAALSLSPALAQETPEKFYAGRSLRIIVPYAPPSGFDSYARTFARHVTKHLPGNPTMAVQAIPGGGGLNAVQNLINVAPRDGSVIGLMLPPNTTDPMLNPEQAKFDPRTFDWLGSISSETATCGIWSPRMKTLDDLKTQEFIMGATGPAGGTAIEARVLKAVFGYRFRMVMGYPGIADIRLGVARGEVDGHCALSLTTLKTEVTEDWRSGKIKLVYQSGLERHPELPDTPTAFEHAKTTEDLQTLKLVLAPWTYGRPITAPPNIPRDRLAALRKAFADTMVDPEFVAEATRLNLEVRPFPPEKMTQLIGELFSTPKEVVERTRRIIAE